MGLPARNGGARVNFNGVIVFDWHGEIDEAVTGPRTLVTLDDDCVAVERAPGGAQIVPWDWVLELRGWSPAAAEEGER
jgi:hypothetical protein